MDTYTFFTPRFKNKVKGFSQTKPLCTKTENTLSPLEMYIFYITFEYFYINII